MTNKFDRIQKNTNKKYVIKNCPCNVTTEDMCDWENTNETYCQDCTDCVMKQIVELCRHYKKHSDCGRECPSFGRFLSKLLDKLDIKEVE